MISRHNNIVSEPHYMLRLTRCIIMCIQTGIYRQMKLIFVEGIPLCYRIERQQ